MRPPFLKKIFQKKHQKKLLTFIVGGLFLLFLTTNETTKNHEITDWFSGYLQTELDDFNEEALPPPTEQTLNTKFDVIKVIDGDTIDVDVDGEKTRIRIIGIDTPETNVYECYGEEATIEARRILEGKKVQLEIDSTQDNKDRYGRLLRFVFIDDVDYGLQMIENGFAEEYTYRKPYKYSSIYRDAQIRAEESDLGMWGGVCEK